MSSKVFIYQCCVFPIVEWASDGGEGGAYPGGRGSIGAVQGCPTELWTRLVGVMEHSGHTGLLGVYWVYTGCIASTTQNNDKWSRSMD